MTFLYLFTVENHTMPNYQNNMNITPTPSLEKAGFVIDDAIVDKFCFLNCRKRR